MYIESTIAEILLLRAESEPGIKQNCPNPTYTEFHKLMVSCLEVPKKAPLTQSEKTVRYMSLLKFIRDLVGAEFEITTWDGYIPDIRLVDTIEEAMGWLADHLDVTDVQ
jgi:hypothetical protein